MGARVQYSFRAPAVKTGFGGYMNDTLNSLKGGYTKENIGEYCRGY